MVNSGIKQILAEKLEETARLLKKESKKTAKYTFQSEALFQMSKLLQNVNSVEDLNDLIIEICSEIFGASSIVLMKYRGQKLVPVKIKEVDQSLACNLLEAESDLVKRLVSHGSVVVLNDLNDNILNAFSENVRMRYGFVPALIINRFKDDLLNQIVIIGKSARTADIQALDIKNISLFNNYIDKVSHNIALIESLKSEKEKLLAILDGVSDGLIYTDTELNIVLLNPVAKKILGSLGEIETGGNIYGILQKFKKSMTCEEILVSDQDVYVDMNLSEEGLYYSTKVSKIRDSKGIIAGMLLIMKDVTEERRTERLKSVFMSTISHKLRTPLTIIKESNALLYEGVMGTLNEKQKKVVGNAYNQSQYLHALINSLLDFTTTEAEIMSTGLRKEMRSIKMFFDDLLFSMKDIFGSKDMKVSFSISDDSLTANIDRDRLQTAVANILDNAVKFNPEKTNIDVSVLKGWNHVLIKIADSGVGIPKAYLSHIFETFSQVDSDLTGQIKGMGLGLYLSKQIVAAHGGEVSCVSEIGKGTEFIIKLPVI